MKLTLNRREEQKKGIFKTSIQYFLDVNLEVTSEEMALIRKHQWDKMPFSNDMIMELSLNYFLGQPRTSRFDSVEQLAYAENQVIENSKSLKQQLESAAGFTSGGPREIEL